MAPVFSAVTKHSCGSFEILPPRSNGSRFPDALRRAAGDFETDVSVAVPSRACAVKRHRPQNGLVIGNGICPGQTIGHGVALGAMSSRRY